MVQYANHSTHVNAKMVDFPQNESLTIAHRRASVRASKWTNSRVTAHSNTFQEL